MDRGWGGIGEGHRRGVGIKEGEGCGTGVREKG